MLPILRRSPLILTIVVYGCQGLLPAISRDILNGFHFSRDVELMHKQHDFLSTSLYPFVILFIQYVVFSTLVPDWCPSLQFPPVTLYRFPVQGILFISVMDLESKYCYFYHTWDFVPYYICLILDIYTMYVK